MALLHQYVNDHWMGSMDSECVELQRTLDCKKKTSTATYPTRRERPLIKKTGWVVTERERQLGRKREQEGERMQCFMKKEDYSVIYVEHLTTYFDNCAFFAALASFLLQCCLVHLSLVSLAFCATYFTFLSDVFIVLSCWRYPSQHSYDF